MNRFNFPLKCDYRIDFFQFYITYLFGKEEYFLSTIVLGPCHTTNIDNQKLDEMILATKYALFCPKDHSSAFLNDSTP